jgi:hypothetical protein
VADDLDEHRFVFVGGLPRSGTTYLAAEIARSPDVSNLEGIGVIADEGQYVQTVYPTQREAGGIDRFAYSPSMHLTEPSQLDLEALRTALTEAWSPYWDTSKPVLLEKTPSNLLKMRFLQALFPASSFVVVIRHPVAQAMAVRGRGWSRRPVAKLIDHWLTAHDIMTDDLPHLARVVVVRYEDLVTSSDKILNGIRTFLDLDLMPVDEDPRQGINDRYFDDWRSGGPLTSIANWRTVRRYEERLAPYGYSLSSPMPVGPLGARHPTLPA